VGRTDRRHGTVFGRQLYPNQTAALAKAKLFADLPVAYQYLSGVSANATEIFKQTLTINAMSQAMHSMAATSGAGNVDVYAQTRADIQTERTYGSIASNAMKWVPLLNVVLTVLFYALFPVLFPLFLLPKTGPLALKGYVTGFFYLAAWGPLFVILHMMLMYKGAADMSAVAGSNGLSLASFTGMADVNSDIGLLAGYLIASVPFLAGGVAKGRHGDFAPCDELSQSEPERCRGSGARSEHGQRLAGQYQLREFERPDPPVRARHDRAQLHLWRGADPNIQRHRLNDDEFPRSQLRPASQLELSLHAQPRTGVHLAPVDNGIAGPLEQRELCEHCDGIDDQRRHEVPRTAQPIQPRIGLRERDRHIQFRQHPDRLQRGRPGIDKPAAPVWPFTKGR
jgi:hypothetical protein